MPTIQDSWLKIKNFTDDALAEWGLIAIVFLVGLGSFGLGRLSAFEDAEPPVSIGQVSTAAQPVALVMGGLVVASRTGSTYYYPWCSGAAAIAPQNQLWFASEQQAQDSGYVPSKSCKGLVAQ